MFPLHEEPQEAVPRQEQPLLGNNINNSNESGHSHKIVKKKIMKTPCDHKFHIPCLKKWLEIKLECPTCRKQIPGLD